MKKMKLLKTILGLGLILFVAAFTTSCDDDDDTPTAPTIKIQVNSVEGFTVDIAAEASADVVSWHWDYGDGNTSDSVGGHYYTYEKGGDYTITCTVKNGAGVEATDTWDVNIATIEELLTGGSSKTWVLSRTAGNIDGVSYSVNSNFTLDMPTAGYDVLAIVGLEEEYDNEFTFNSDGSYSLNFGVGGSVLAGWVYSSREQADNIVKTTGYGIYSLKVPVPDEATWSLHKNTDLTVNAVYDKDQDNSGGVEETVVFESVNYITFEGDGFIGMKDYNSYAIVRNVSKESLTVTIFWSSYYDNEDLGIYNLPSMMLTLTLVPKN
jgi:PKD repeat protein